MSDYPKICGLWRERVAVSEYNRNGHCMCFGCMATHCTGCVRYNSIQAHLLKSVGGNLMCTSCISVGTEKQR